MLLIFSIGAALTNMFGRMVGDERQGWAIFAVMGLLFLAGTAIVYRQEAPGNPFRRAACRSDGQRAAEPAATWRARRSASASPIRRCSSTITTDASCGAVNSMHDSLMPLGGMIPMFNIKLGEIIFGGVGSGLYGMLLFAILAVFIAGLMVGRTPEYLGKKIEANEVKMAMLAILILPLSILGFTALARLSCRMAWPGRSTPARMAFSEILYAYTSATGNNGSAFAGLTANTLVLQLDARHRDADRPLPDDRADAGGRRVARRKEDRPPSAGTFPTDGGLFVGLLIGVILIVGGLTYFPGAGARPDRRASRDDWLARVF